MKMGLILSYWSSVAGGGASNGRGLLPLSLNGPVGSLTPNPYVFLVGSRSRAVAPEAHGTG